MLATSGNAEAAERVSLSLSRGAAIAGRVVDDAGKPVGGARVVAQVEPSELPRHVASGWAYSDRDGRFRIEALAPGAFELVAEAGDLGRTSVAVVARPTTTSRELTLKLTREPVARVSGHVFHKGAPVSGVTISAVQAMPIGMTVTQADGSFVFERLRYGPTRFLVSPNTAEPAAQLDITRPVVDNVRLEVTTTARVHGRVTLDGKPVVGAPIVYTPAPQTSFYGAPLIARSDASGAFTLSLPVGPGQLIAWDSPTNAFADPVQIVMVADDDKAVDFELYRLAELRGTVVDEAGAPVRGVYVQYALANGGDDWCETLTDARGEFVCARLTGGEYRATVTPSPGARQAFAPAVGDHFDLARVPRAGVTTGIKLAIKNERLAIRGTVVDDTGSPIPDVHITALARGDASMDPPSTLSDPAGHFEIDNLARGTYILRAHAADGSEAELPGVAAGSASASLRLARAGAIEGTLTGFAVPPVVFVMSSDGRPGGGRAAIIDGTKFSRIGLPAGRYTVEATEGADVDGQSVEIKPGETTHVELRSRGAAPLEGTVLDLATRKPLAGMRCDAKISMNGQASPIPSSVAHQALTDAAGNFKMSAPRGRVRLFCFSPSPAPLSAAGTDVDVSTGSVAKATVFSVRSTFGSAPSDPGFMLTRMLLPLTVDQVLPSGPAAAAGLRPGDQLLAIDGESLAGVLPEGATTLLMNHRSGTTVTLGISRAGVAQTIKLTVGAGP